jgi:hypothetical protein
MGNLTFQPVRRYGVPAYPTKLSIAADPTLLRQHVPRHGSRSARSRRRRGRCSWSEPWVVLRS